MQSKQGVVKIALIDSGIDYTRTEFRDAKLHFLNECKDHIGHGTAVASIIHKVSPEAELYIYRLLDEETVEVGSEQLTDVLNYLKQFKFDVIHLSCGVITSDQLKQLEHSCTGLINEGAVIVSAYDDYGRVSYPAAFENVIGVDWDIECSDGLKYTFVENSPVNILGSGALLRLPWIGGEYRTVAGSSFAAPYITGLVANLLSEGAEPGSIKKLLRDKAKNVISVDRFPDCTKQTSININKAIVYPVNKEIHNLLTYTDLLSFEIVGAYEPPIFRNVGKKAKEICGFGDSSTVVESDKRIQWENGDFDTLILGHTKLYSRALRRDVIKEFMQKCIEYRKNLFAFDDLSGYDELAKEIRKNKNFCYYPRVDEFDVDRRFLNKLYGINSPVLGVVGTSSKQG